MKISVKLHSFKEQIFKFYFFHNKLYRGWGLFLAGILFVVVLETILFLSYCAKPYSLLLQVAQILFSVSTLVFGGVFVCFLCLINMRGIYRNIFFIFLFTIGVIGYITVANNKAEISEKNILSCNFNAEITTEAEKIIITSNSNESYKQQFVDKKERFLQWFSKIFVSAVHHSHMALAAFFPSRGNYEIEEDGTLNSKEMEFFTLFLYFVFHTFVYIFTAYFIVSHWGYRTTNRLRFWLTRDDEKNVFWCVTPGPKMLTLAKDIIKKYRETAQPIFTVEEAAVSDPKSLFQEMNYHGLCLKLRKPDQIHSNCLCAARHFFLSEDSDWNVNMARALLAKRKKYGIESFTQLYIKISDEVREVFFNRWADDNNEPGKVDIVMINEAEMIAEKFVAENPMLKTIEATEINTETATIPDSEFKVLIIGFGRIGRALLKHFICDSQFIKNLDKDTYANNVPLKKGVIEHEAYCSQRERVPFSADIIDCDTECWTIFKHAYKEACQRFNLKFLPIRVLSNEFFNLQWKNLKNYNRVVIALGEPELNIEVAAVIENIVRKNLILSSSENNENSDEPQKQLEEIKKRCFLVSPEINNYHDDGSCSENLYNNDENLFSLAESNYEIYSCENIIEEKLSVMAKFVALGYSINYDKNIVNNKADDKRKKHASLRQEYGMPVLPWNYTLEDFPYLPPEQKKKIMKSWYTCYDENTDKLTAEPMYGRKSSRASAANLKNILSLLGLDESEESLTEYKEKIKNEELKNNLGRMEHLRWIAYMLLEGYELWKAPLKTAEVSKANQSKKYYRHAALVEYEDLPDIDKIFPDNKTFYQKDLEIIENLPLFYRELNMLQTPEHRDCKSSEKCF